MRKTQELEKFKFVLDYKIKELRRDIGPREEEISKMKEQLEVMKSEVEEFKRTNAHLRLFVNDFELKLKGNHRNYRTYHARHQERNTGAGQNDRRQQELHHGFLERLGRCMPVHRRPEGLNFEFGLKSLTC